MSELGDLLVLLHGARGRITTVRATVRTWRHLARSQAAMERAARRGHVALYSPLEAEPEPESEEERVRLWLAPPDRAREERGASVGVRRGQLWWHYDPVDGALSNEQDPEVGGPIGEESWWLVDPAPMIGVLDFDQLTPGRFAGRSSVRVRAVPRVHGEEDGWPLAQLGVLGADELLLDVDAERGALLRLEARIDGQPLEITEVEEVAFDETFADETFVFTPPPGEEIRSTMDRSALRHHLPIEQAVALAPFNLWIPARMPAGWETEIIFAAERDRPPIAPHVHLLSRTPDGMHTVSIAESPTDHPGEHSDYEHARPNPWRDVERDGRRMQVREPAEDWQPAQVRLELDGTRIHIHSRELNADWLVGLAAGLVPAPAEPPEL